MGFKRSSSVATDIEVVKNHELDLSTYKRIYRQFDDAFKQEYAELSTKFLSNAIVQDFATELLINTEKDCVIAGTNDFAYVYVICNRKKREEALKHPNEASRVYELFKSIVYFGTVLNRSLENRRRQHGDAHFPPADFQLLCVDQLTKEALPQELNDVSKWVLLNEFILATFRDFYTLRDQNSRAGVYHLTHMMYNQFYIDECQKVRLRVDLSIKLLTSMLCGSAVSAIQRQKAQRYQLPSTTVVTTNAAYMSTINEIVNQGPHIQLPLDEYHRVQTLGAYVIVCRAELAIARSMEMSSEKLKLLLSSVHYFGVVCANSFAFRLYEHRLTAFNGDFDMIPLSCLLFW
ncbi:hypothetical protein M3Y94_01294900 [Aphelenchoides besseyi]|nr:hypothetical protein M3Y94_01294900 [Aphelenchoides besseyi]